MRCRIQQRLLIVASALILSGVLLSQRAEARAEAKSRYTKSQTYSGALRYLRVDLGYEVVEKDPQVAYLIFRYTPPNQDRTTNGSIEIIENRDDVRVLVQLPQMPSYHETVLRDGLMRKLRREYGEPPPRKPDKPDEPDEPEKPSKPDEPEKPDS